MLREKTELAKVADDFVEIIKEIRRVDPEIGLAETVSLKEISKLSAKEEAILLFKLSAKLFNSVRSCAIKHTALYRFCLDISLIRVRAQEIYSNQ